eukprot:15068278-Alexandrium_andersonii.AAC.1
MSNSFKHFPELRGRLLTPFLPQTATLPHNPKLAPPTRADVSREGSGRQRPPLQAELSNE